MQPQDSTLTLDYVTSKIYDWRCNKKHRSELMPEELKILIVRLTQFYSANQISASLRISLTTLYQFKKAYANCISINSITEEANLEFTNTPSKSNPTEQKINFIPIQISSLVTSEHKIDNTTDSSLNASISSNLATTETCQIIRPDGAKLVLNTSNPTVIIQAFLCFN